MLFLRLITTDQDYERDRTPDLIAYCPQGLAYDPYTGAPIPAYWSSPIRYSSTGQNTHLSLAGGPYDRSVPLDWDGDGKTDDAVYRADQRDTNAGNWFIRASSRVSDPNYTYNVVHYGEPSIAPGDEPLVGQDFDGDGKDDIAVWRRATGEWFYKKSSAGGASTNLGVWGDQKNYKDIPMPGDYDGDGKADLAVFRPTDGKWYVLLSSKNYSRDYRIVSVPWGSPGDWHVPADYEGDGRTDFAVWRPSDSKWYVLLSSKNYDHTQAAVLGPYGGSGMVPVPDDYDNDGRTDVAVSDLGYFSIAYSAGGEAQRVPLTEAIGNNSCLYNLHLALAYSSTSPVLIDTLGNGFQLTDIAGGVRFDFAGAGRKITTAWTESDSDDAFLALDLNENGSIDNGRELFGDMSTQPISARANGFLALAEYDKPANGGNGDGVIDTLDRVFDTLRLWQDSNHNGSSEPGELSPLSAQGISTLGINFAESRRTDSHGNQFKYRARVLDGLGNQLGRWAWDVFFAASDL